MNPSRKTRSVRIESLEARSMFAADAMPWMSIPAFSMDREPSWRAEPNLPSRDLARDIDRGPSPFHQDYDGKDSMHRMDGFDSRRTSGRSGPDTSWITTAPVQIEIVVLTLPPPRIYDVRVDSVRPEALIITSWNSVTIGNSSVKPRSNDSGGIADAIASMRDALHGLSSNASPAGDRAPIVSSASRDPLANPNSEDRIASSMVHGVTTLAGAWLSSGTVSTALASSAWNAWVQSDVSMLSKLDGRAMPWSDVARRAFESVDAGSDSKSQSLLDPTARDEGWSDTARETSIDQAFAEWDINVSGRTPTQHSRTPRFELGHTALPSASHATLADRNRMLLMRTPRSRMDVPTNGEETKPIQLLSSFGMLPPIAVTLNHEGMLSSSAPEQHGTQVVSWTSAMESSPAMMTHEQPGRSSDEATTATPTQRWLYTAATTAIVSAWVALQTRRAARATSTSQNSETIVPKPNVRNLRSE
ncbi:MAG: hypothetical protein ACK5OB_00110 [Pirellula sp.]